MMRTENLNATARLAQKFRLENGLSMNEAVNVKSLIRKLNILTVYRPMSYHAYGLSLKSPKGHRFILVNSNSSRGRQHFTIAHELYHLYYDENPRPHICGKDGTSRTERNADRFASALLMPEEGVIGMLTDEEYAERRISIAQVLRLEQYFGVSRSTILIRLKELNLLSATQFEDLKAYPIIRSAKEYGYDVSLYQAGNENLVIGDYGEKARMLFESERISEGHYLELLNLIQDE